jgi:DNA-binding CsgD family transcriptional regulator
MPQYQQVLVFLGGFDLDAAQAVAGAGEVERHQVLDLLTLLIDKSLVVAENASGPSRYRRLETVRQYAQEKLGESGEADAVRNRHREHYTALAAAPVGYEQRIARAEANIDNLRAAFTWSRETDDITTALRLVSALYPLWSTRGSIQEGLAWFAAILTDDNMHDREVPPAVRARALADKTLLDAVVAATDNADEAELGVRLAREAGDPVLLVRTLTACGRIAVFHPEVARPYFAEAIELARTLGNRRRLSDILAFQAYGACVAGDPTAARVAAEEGRDLADEIGDRALSRLCRLWLATAHVMRGNVTLACTEFDDLLAEADAAHDPIYMALCLINQCRALTYGGAGGSAQAAANAALAASREFVVSFLDTAYCVLVGAALAAGDVAAAADASEAARQHTTPPREPVLMAVAPMAEAALARGDLKAATWWADKAISVTTGWCLSTALTARARVAIAQGEPEQAERDAHEALARAAEVEAYLGIPDTLECLAGLAGDASSHPEAARLFGAAEAFRQRMGVVRFKIHDAGYEASVAALRDAMGEQDFDTAWKEGASLSIDEAIAYTQRGRGERKRPTSGWSSLTPAEREVVRLVSEGLANKDIATRLFVSPRTVQTHLTHVYTKLGLTSRVQLVQEAARRT